MREDTGEKCATEVFDLVTKKLRWQLNDLDIEVAHRFPAKTKTWPVIVQIRSQDLKLDVSVSTLRI